MNVYRSKLLALRWGALESNFKGKKRYVTLEWPLKWRQSVVSDGIGIWRVIEVTRTSDTPLPCRPLMTLGMRHPVLA